MQRNLQGLPTQANLADEPDKRILEHAVAGRTDVVVTGDKAILALGTFRAHYLSLTAYLAKR